MKQHISDGYVLIAILTTVSFVIVAAVSVATLASTNLRIVKTDSYRLAAQFAADAGADQSLQDLYNDPDWTTSGGEQEVTLTSAYRSTYEASIEDGLDDLHKTIIVTGRTYAPVTSSTPVSEREYAVNVRALTAGSFSVVSGVGGLTMKNSSKIIGGSVHVNGKIEMSNSSQIGLASGPVSVSVAHHNCPLGGGASYPSLCPSGSGSPITINSPARIYGDVRANNGSSIPGTTLDRMTPSTLTASSGVVANELPEHDRSAQITATNDAIVTDSTRSMTSSEADCTTNNGSKTWKANSKVVGNVTVNKSCTVTVEGDIWITGNLDMSQSGTIQVANGVTTPPVIMIDGTSGLTMSNSSIFASNSSRVGFRVITYHSEASCSPDCADVTGQDLYDTSDVVTINIANTANGPNTEFYARWSAVELANSGGIGALVGQTVIMSNSAAVTFGVEVSGISTIEGWVIESYRRSYN